MENVHNQSLVRSYETPAVTYEATLVVHAGISSVTPCGSPADDLLDLTKTN